MYKSKDFTVLRSWSFTQEQNTREPKELFNELIEAIGTTAYITDVYIDGHIPGIEIRKPGDGGYMGVYCYILRNHNDCSMEMAVEGKGNQVKATDMISLYQKSSAVLSGLYGSYSKSKSALKRFGYGGTGSSIGAGLSVAAGAAIGGSARLVAKGVRTLMRDNDIYNDEMGFYTEALGMGDYLIGGVDNNNIVTRMLDNAEKGNVKAQVLLGHAYYEGRGVEADLRESMNWFEKAASQGDKDSKYILYSEYLFGENSYSEEEKALGLKYLTEFADDGDEMAQANLIYVYTGAINIGLADSVKAFSTAEKYEEYGNVHAIMTLARMYDSAVPENHIESPVFKDDSRAIELYKRVIGAEEAILAEEAAVALGVMYNEGVGTEPDLEQAAKYYGIAAAHGNLEAKQMLAVFYTVGRGVEKNHNVAKDLCRELRQSGDPEAIAAADLCTYRIEDEAGNYRTSMDYARRYIESPLGEEPLKEECRNYLADKESFISTLTESERKEYLKEAKPVMYSSKPVSTGGSGGKGKYIAIAVGAIVIILIAVMALGGRSGNNYDNSYDSSYDSEYSYEDDYDYYGEPEDDYSYSDDHSGGEPFEVYNEFLSGDTVIRDFFGTEYVWQLDNCDFAVAYIDYDDVPELLLYNWPDTDQAAGYGMLYTIEDGEVTFVTNLELNDVRKIGYYERTGWYIDIYCDYGVGDVYFNNLEDGTYGDLSLSVEYTGDLEADITEYYIYGEVSESEFMENLDRLTEGEPLTEYEFYHNSPENREKVFGL